MRVVSSASEGLPGDLYSKVARYRHKVFVERLGWPLKTQNGVELDQFDRPDTVYVVAQDDDGCVVGCARLIPTSSPYLLGEVFPQLLNGLTPPCSPDVWELSRFAAVGFNNRSSRTTSALRQFSSPLAIKLLQESIACAASHDAKRLITVSPIGVERLLQSIGVNAHRAGPPMVVDGHPIIACWIEI
jgi:acyl homoserine lactone synthase